MPRRLDLVDAITQGKAFSAPANSLKLTAKSFFRAPYWGAESGSWQGAEKQPARQRQQQT